MCLFCHLNTLFDYCCITFLDKDGDGGPNVNCSNVGTIKLFWKKLSIIDNSPLGGCPESTLCARLQGWKVPFSSAASGSFLGEGKSKCPQDGVPDPTVHVKKYIKKR